MSNRTLPEDVVKPKKPYPAFPLNAHKNGQWYRAKRIGGRVRFFYFGHWHDDPRGERALKFYLAVASNLEAGDDSFTASAAVQISQTTIDEVAAAYMELVHHRAETKQIGLREFDDVRLACMEHFLNAVGDRMPADRLAVPISLPNGQIISPLEMFARYLDQRMKAYAYNRNMSKVRGMLKWAYKTAKLIAEPLHEHESLANKKKKIRRRQQRLRDARFGAPIYQPWECVKIVEAAACEAARTGSPILAMILIAMNSGWGNSQIADVPISVIQAALKSGIVDWIRVKTEEIAQFPLWAITKWAIEQYLPNRPKPKLNEDQDLLFVTRCGNRWVRELVKRDAEGAITAVNPDDAISKELRKIEEKIGTKRERRALYAFRHTFSSAANDLQDQDATRRIMGHGFEGMDPHYLRSQFTTGKKRERLEVIVRYVGHELLGSVELSDSVNDKAERAAPCEPNESSAQAIRQAG